VVPAPNTNIVAAFAWLELLVSDVHLLSTERAGAVAIVTHGRHWRAGRGSPIARFEGTLEGEGGVGGGGGGSSRRASGGGDSSQG